MIEQKYFWKVGDCIFFNKNEALRESTRSGNSISFHVGPSEHWRIDKNNNFIDTILTIYI